MEKVLLICPVWNEEHIIKFFLYHYSGSCDKMIFINLGCTDNSISYIKEYSNTEILELPGISKTEIDERTLLYIKNDFRKTFKNKYQWFIICDTDEFLYFPLGISGLIKEMEKTGCNIIKPTGWQMVGDKFPKNDLNLLKNIQYGVSGDWDKYYGKSILFNNQIDITYSVGCHSHSISFNARYYKDIDLKLLHYKYVNIANVILRKNITNVRLSKYNLEHNLGVHNCDNDETWLQSFYELKSKAIKVI